MRLAQGPQLSDADEARTHGPLVLIQALYHCAPKTYVVGTQKNRFNEMVLLSTKNICYKLYLRKYLQFYAEIFCLPKPMFIVCVVSMRWFF